MTSEFVESQEEPSAANEQVPYSKEELSQIAAVNDIERDFVALCNGLGTSRELSVAITNCQTAAMWAIRHILAKRKARKG